MQPPDLSGVQRTVALMKLHHERHGHCCHTGADDDGRKRECLRNGIHKITELGDLSLRENRSSAAGHIADGDDEEIDTVVCNGEPDNSLYQVKLGDNGIEAVSGSG